MAFLQILIITPSFLNPPAADRITGEYNKLGFRLNWKDALDVSPDSTETGSPLVQIVSWVNHL